MLYEQLCHLTVKKLVEYCKEKYICGYSRKRKDEIIKMIISQNSYAVIGDYVETNSKLNIKNTGIDKLYTKEVLKEQYKLHTQYVKERIKFAKRTGIKIRLPALPEDISENMIKFMIILHSGVSSKWIKTECAGDLYSDEEHKQECKCFTSNGPISFTPSSLWDIIYFLDARNWLSDHFILYRVNMTKKDFGKLKINKNQKFDDQCKQGRRPRIGWKLLFPQIKNKTTVIFDGCFDDI